MRVSEKERMPSTCGCVRLSVCVRVCFVQRLYFLVLFFAYLFFYEPLPSLSFCFVSHLLCIETKHVWFYENATLYKPH